MTTLARLEPLYIGTDYTYRFQVTNGEKAPLLLALDVSTWSLSFMVKKKINDLDVNAIVEKHNAVGIDIEGAFNASPAQNLQVIKVRFVDTDTNGKKAGDYPCELKRMDSGFENILFQGALPFADTVHKT